MPVLAFSRPPRAGAAPPMLGAAPAQRRGAVTMLRPQRPRGALNFAVTWLGFIVRLVGQLGYFLLVARALGPSDYGMVASVFALLVVFGAFAGWGSDHVLIRNVTEAPERFGRYFGNALMQIDGDAAAARPSGLRARRASSSAWRRCALARLLSAIVFRTAPRAGDLLLHGVRARHRSAAHQFRIQPDRASSPAAPPSRSADPARPSTLGRNGISAGAALSGLLSTGYVIARLGRPRWYFARA